MLQIKVERDGIKVSKCRIKGDKIVRVRPKLTKEEREEEKQRAKWRKEDRIRERENKLLIKEEKRLYKKELEVLTFMKKTDVLYHHHGTSESMRKTIEEQIIRLKETKEPTVYHQYIWNYRGEGNNRMLRSELGCLFRSSEFDTPHDVPLDGTYVFEMYDSGQRGCGSFHGLTVRKVEEKSYIPKVDPGGIIPITAF